jgi:hypothetical protein
MPRLKGLPAYRLHRSSGQARVIIDRRHVYRFSRFRAMMCKTPFLKLFVDQFSEAPFVRVPISCSVASSASTGESRDDVQQRTLV